MFRSVLVANRGEIAVRICRTLRTMGIRSVVVASIPDRRSLAARSADAMVLLEGYSAAETYLDVEAIIAAAKAEACEAIHPGYGFLSERAGFAERCAAEGLVFVGPPPAVLRTLGDKSAARQLAVANGIPVVPGYDGPDDDPTLMRQAERLGAPLMVKARGGGGGRGMREVHDLADLPESLAAARREAEAAFGDPGLLLEKLITKAHHVEVQVLADAHGHYVHLGERDCSVQRRRQKLIEETPSPVVDAALREQLTAAALRLARAANYVNAGTVEFLVASPRSSDEGQASESPSSPLPPSSERGERGEGATTGPQTPSFYFLEVNPRLQVEHPVTEMVTGLDLVELQLRVAAGEPLSFTQEDIAFTGHAIEFRVNAEDPSHDFRPSTGRLRRQRLMAHHTFERVDRGYDEGDAVSGYYDSLIAKLVFHGDDRGAALAYARKRLDPVAVSGVTTNIALHRAVVEHDAFYANGVTVAWLEQHLAGLISATGAPEVFWAAVSAALSHLDMDRRPIPFASTNWVGASEPAAWLSDGVTIRAVRPAATATPVRVVQRSPRDTTVVVGTEAGEIKLVAIPDHEILAFRDEETYSFELVPPPTLPHRPRAAAGGASAITAPLAGTVSSVRVAAGDTVEPGDLLLTLDAMKMEHRITATIAGTVAHIHVAAGAVVREGDVLVEVT